MSSENKLVKYACYTANITMSVVASISPVLFLTFRSLYGISYSLLGTLILINFFTQLIVDLLLSFFSHKFNIPKTVKAIPFIAAVGFLVYALWPFIVPDHVYIGLVIGTVIFSAASGLNEVLISPVIAALPSDNPDREMSKLHSAYAWGVVAVLAISTVYLFALGGENWQWLILGFVLIPLTSAILFLKSKIPAMETPERASNAVKLLKNGGVWLCVSAIFLGGAAECTMAQWSSGYLEKALAIPKIWGDLLGVAMFSVMLGLGRSLYAKSGKNIGRVLTLGAAGAAVCYVIAALSNTAWVGLVACALTGFCVSMLWPGNLIVASSRFPAGGVFIYALMAAGGDLGASVAPQFVGIITDAVIENPKMIALAQNLSLAPEQLGMKIALLFAALFPILAVFANLRFCKKK